MENTIKLNNIDIESICEYDGNHRYIHSRRAFENESYYQTIKENNDCTVLALACVLGCSYESAHKHMSKHQLRRYRKGPTLKEVKEKFVPSFKNWRVVVGPYSKSESITVNQFVKKHPIGRFFVVVRGHAFAIIDGLVYDYKSSIRRKIVYALRFYPPKPKP